MNIIKNSDFIWVFRVFITSNLNSFKIENRWHPSNPTSKKFSSVISGSEQWGFEREETEAKEKQFVHRKEGQNLKLWAATWLYKATRKEVYLSYLKFEAISAYVAEFSWDLKYAGAQILITKLIFECAKGLDLYKQQADSFVCSNLPDSPYHQVFTTPGGMIHLRDGANSQYVTSTAFLFSA